VSGLKVIQRLQASGIRPEELEDIYRQHQDEYRVLLHLAQHPRFPQGLAQGILSKLFAVDLVRVIKNVRTNPFIRKKAELEFGQRYRRLALGEKISLLKAAPNALLLSLSEENHPQLIRAILQNPNCSEDVILRFVNRTQDRSHFYQVLYDTHWPMNPAVAQAIAHDPEAPVRMLVKVIPYLDLTWLQTLFCDPTTHRAVRDSIRDYLQQRRP
jgi:hypothetical protein